MRSDQRGFTVLEVIAALAIVAIALVPILSLRSEMARRQSSLQETATDSTALQNSISLLRDLNPMVTPRGQRDLGEGAELTWTSTPITDATPTANAPGFEVRLYRVDAEIRSADAATNYTMELLGWRNLAAMSGSRRPTPAN